MWIPLTITAAFFNALWTALSKNQLAKFSPYQFTMLFRGLTACWLFPIFIYTYKSPANPIFWLLVLGAGILEMIGIYAQAAGIRKDYYSTFSLSNTSPLFTLIIAPQILPEEVNLFLVFGVVFVVSGGFIFYQLQRKLYIYGLIRALTLAISTIMAKIAIGYSSALTYPFLAFMTGALFMIVLNHRQQHPVTRKNINTLLTGLAPIALISAIATVCYYLALEQAAITKVNPLIRTNLIFGFFLSYFFLKERLDIKRKIIASSLILLGAVLITIS